jgi:hypothetical protein
MKPAQCKQVIETAKRALPLLDPDWDVAKQLRMALIAVSIPAKGTPIELEPSMTVCACGHQADSHMIGLHDELLHCSDCDCNHFCLRGQEAT